MVDAEGLKFLLLSVLSMKNTTNELNVVLINKIKSSYKE